MCLDIKIGRIILPSTNQWTSNYMLDIILHSHYKIIKSIGGKSGLTYLAADLDRINSPLYVVKKIQVANNINVTQQLFEIQGSIADRVGQHPQIPSLVARFTENGDRYLVREYIEGEILDQELVPGSTWSQTQGFDFLVELMGILAFVHSFKYIHQDITPHHIIRANTDGRFNLIGFSSTRDLGNSWQNSPIDHNLNPNYSNYIPYEQEQNSPQFNSDIYAVGTIAIQALTGKNQIVRDPHTYELDWKNDLNIDQQLVKIIDQMVRPDYRNRYQSALEVLADLQSFALTQIPTHKTHQFKPYLIFGGAICTILLGFGIAKLFSIPTNEPQLIPPAPKVTKTLTSTINQAIDWQYDLDKTAKIKIKYPPKWTKNDLRNIVTGEHVMFTSPKQNSSDKYQENISIRIENLTNPQTTLADYTRLTIAEITKYSQGAKIIESSPVRLANRPANLVVYTGKDENSLPIKSLEVWMIDRGKAYILTSKAETKHYYQFLGTTMTTIDSFELN
jgi:eukaryotic-like serine/threonine-protein kinase